jgi:hypothetical protein
MEESKLQSLVDTLSKHRKSEGLGVGSSAYSWSGTHVDAATANTTTTNDLPQNALYSLFRKEGSYDPAKAALSNHGDGRVIQRFFGDCSKISDDNDDTKTKKKGQLTKEERKEQKKAERKAAKLEAKRLAKLEEKKRLKKEASKNLKEEEPAKKKRKAETETSTPNKKKKVSKRETDSKSDKSADDKPAKKDKKVKKEWKKDKEETTTVAKAKKSKKGKSA